MQLEVIRITAAEQMEQALSVRRAVFIQEQNVDEAIEIDGHDGDPLTVKTAVHVLGLLNGEPVATGRLLLGDGPEHEAHIGRVAVLASLRGQGHGRTLMAALHELAHELGYQEVALSAQVHAIGFYEGLGYEAHGDVYLDAGIPHRDMTRRL